MIPLATVWSAGIDTDRVDLKPQIEALRSRSWRIVDRVAADIHRRPRSNGQWPWDGKKFLIDPNCGFFPLGP